MLETLILSPFEAETYKRWLSSIFTTWNPRTLAPISIEHTHVSSYHALGTTLLDDGRELAIFLFELKEGVDLEHNRVSLHKVLESRTKEILADGAIAAFYKPSDPSVWRFSFLRFTYDENDKQIVTASRRFTYLLGHGVATKTASKYLNDLKPTSLDKIQEVFSVERVSKEFFEEYRKLFEQAVEHLKVQKGLFIDEESLHAYTKKLLGRIVFLYFLQKKGWLGVKNQGDWGSGDKNFIHELFKSYPNNFYAQRLAPLFFETLNRNRPDGYSDIFDCYIPFLNGGLFDECKGLDDRVIIDDSIFAEIFAVFDRYNFTVIEDTPHDSEVAIDPEMLGRVFENLLEENYRKGKGAFYTPREIVHYMCQSSIENYLENQTKNHQSQFGVDEFLAKASLSDDEICAYYREHPQKYLVLKNYFENIKPYKNLVVNFRIVAKLRGFLKEGNELVKSDIYRGHDEISSDLWQKILNKEYIYHSHVVGSNKQIRIDKQLFVYPTLIKYVQITDRFFALAFFPNLYGDLELTTIFPIRQRGIKSKIVQQYETIQKWEEKDFAFGKKVLEELKSSWRDCHSPHTVLEHTNEQEHNTASRFSEISHKLFNADSLTAKSLKEHLSLKWYDLKVNKILNDSTIPQKDLRNLMLENIKSIKVLDPAIGSGAFPMGMLHEIVQVRVHLGDKTPHAKLKREIIENSIYGVDIDFDAVEIAKLRFWLSLTVDEDTPSPLPNLDFKIMQGNSLVETINGFSPIPSDIYDKQEKQMTTLFDTKAPSLLDKKIFDKLTVKIHDFYNDSTGDKKQSDKDEIKTLIREIIEGYLKSESKEYDAREKDLHLFASNKKQLVNTMASKLENISIAKTVLAELLSNNFQTKELFLYKLFFGEVLKEGGFDVVIGNPPYIRQEKIKELKPKLQIEGYKSFNGTADIYVYFFEQGYRLLKNGGVLSFITSNKYARAKYGKEFRDFVLKNTNILEYIDFNGVKVFESATVDTSILSFRKSASVVRPELVEGSCGSISSPRTESTFTYCDITAEYKKGENLTTFCDKNGFDYVQNDLSIDSFSFANPKELKIKKKIEKIGTPLKEWDIKINYGIKTGFNEAFIIDTAKRDELIAKDAKSAEIIKPMLRGRDIKAYTYDWADLWIIVVRHGFNKELYHYPAISEHLFQYEQQLKNRGQCTNKNGSGQHHWLELDNNPSEDYILQFEVNKIIYPEFSSLPCFTYDNENYFTPDTAWIIAGGSKFLTALLNSKTVWFYLKSIVASLGEASFRMKKIYLDLLPIPQIFNESQKTFEILVDYIIFSKSQKLETEAKFFESVIDVMVYGLYFEEEMKKADCYITDEVQKLIKEFDETDEMLKSMYKEFKENKTIMRGLTYSRTVDVVKIINGGKK